MSPPYPPPPAGTDSFFCGRSVISVSVVRTIAAMDAAFWRADRVTLAASTMPFSNMSPYSPLRASKPWPRGQRLHALDDDFAVRAGVVGDLADGRFERAAQDAEAHRLVAHELDQVERRDGLEQGHAAARDQALFDRCAGGGERVLDAVLLLLELDLGARTGRQGVHDRPADRGDTRSRSARAR